VLNCDAVWHLPIKNTDLSEDTYDMSPLEDEARRPARFPVDFGAIADAQSGGVAHIAHIAGLIFGAVTGRLLEHAYCSSRRRRLP